MERRQFLKTGCSFCLLAAAGTMLPTLLSYAGDKTKVYKTTINENKQAEIPLDLFESGNLQFIRIKHWYYDIAVHKEEDATYTAILMKCTHMDNQLNITGEGFQCSLHGSKFDKKGVVTQGPAESPLTTYATTVQDKTLLITIPHNEEEE